MVCADDASQRQLSGSISDTFSGIRCRPSVDSPLLFESLNGCHVIPPGRSYLSLLVELLKLCLPCNKDGHAGGQDPHRAASGHRNPSVVWSPVQGGGNLLSLHSQHAHAPGCPGMRGSNGSRSPRPIADRRRSHRSCELLLAAIIVGMGKGSSGARNATTSPWVKQHGET